MRTGNVFTAEGIPPLHSGMPGRWAQSSATVMVTHEALLNAETALRSIARFFSRTVVRLLTVVT